MSGLRFTPVVGTDARIRSFGAAPGHVYFATDSKKIYYSDGESLLSMGGNTGIYYGNLTFEKEPDSDQDMFDFSLGDIDGNSINAAGNYKKPNVEDLILNLPDGCFYRVIRVTGETYSDTVITAQKLTISGSGGGGGGNSPGGGLRSSFIFTDPLKKDFVRYVEVKKVKNYILEVNVSSTVLENNGIAKMEYTIGTLTPQPISNASYKDFGRIPIDISEYLPRMSTSTATRIAVSFWDTFNTKSTVYFDVYAIDLSIDSPQKDKGILTTQTKAFSFSCTPTGGRTLVDKEIYIRFKNAEGAIVGTPIRHPVKNANSQIPLTPEVPDLGAYTMEVSYRGKASYDDTDWISSNTIVLEVVYFDENPVFVVNVPSLRIEQYSTLTVQYMIAAVSTSVDALPVKRILDTVETPTTVKYNTMASWDIYFDKPGSHTIAIETTFGSRYFDIFVYDYEGNLPEINTEGLTLNYSATNRSNHETTKDSWESNSHNFIFSNFAWGEINGWQQDEDNNTMLRLSSGAKITLPSFHFFDEDVMEDGHTIELDFKISGVTDFSKPLIHCLSYDNEGKEIQVGFHITGQESTFNTVNIKATGAKIKEDEDGDGKLSEDDQIYNTQIQGLTARFIENERIHLSWVIDSKDVKYPMIKTYLNGKVTGITQYPKDDAMYENRNKAAVLTFDSEFGIIDIYNIRVYKHSALSNNNIVDNYIATYGTAAEKSKKYADNDAVMSDDGTISIEKIETVSDRDGFKLPLPYIKIIGGQSLIKDDVTGNYSLAVENVTAELPTAKKDFRLISSYEFIDPNGVHPKQTVTSEFKDDGTLNGLVMYGQGTSSMEYPVKNLRIKSKQKINNQKTLFKVNDHSVDLICLKADYMESSGSHNTGTGNLIVDLLKMLDLKTPAQEHYTKNDVGYEVVTAIQGFPVLIFFKSADAPEDEPFEFVGKYNYNLDKATQEPFGFFHDEREGKIFGWDPNEKIKANVGSEKAFTGYPFDLYVKENDDTYTKLDMKTATYDSSLKDRYYSIKNKIHCYEFLNNGSNLVRFQTGENETFEESFYKIVKDSDGKDVPNWFTAYESRYPEFGDYASTDIDSWYEFCNWVASTENNPDKFAAEFHDHLDLDFMCFYYILTNILLMIDSRAKNLMMATWDNQHWFPIFYDMDTMLGLNNYGYNKYYYNVEDIDPGIYNAKDSVLWNNFREAFKDEIRDCYQELQTKGFGYEQLLAMYNDKQANVANENIYNEDSKYKYIRPFSEGYYDTSGTKPVYVEPGKKDYLYASQGDRSMHRKWWIKNRVNYFDGKYLSENYKKDKYILRLYTPEKGVKYYAAQHGLTEDEFNANKDTITYWIKLDNGTYQKATSEFIADITYYVYVSDSARLDASIEAVKPNNDFTLTPLYDQYLAIAYGGDNGSINEPLRVKANIETLMPAPLGSKYNDTETYIYGGSTLKDLGDLSSQYLGQFHFPNEQTKLEYLTLGNFDDKYYNPNFASLQIGNSAPYLKELNIVNCLGLAGRSLDAGDCQTLKKIYATGSNIGSITLPQHGVLDELRLPPTIRSLKIIDQPKLQNANFTIGTYTSATKKYTNITPTDGKKTGKIIQLEIENTPIDTYALVKNNPLQRFKLHGINWRITDSKDIVNGTNITALDELLACDPINKNDTLAQSLTGTITIASGLLTLAQAKAIYQKYAVKKSADDTDCFPNVEFVFEGLKVFNVTIYDGNDSVHWKKKLFDGESINLDFLKSGPYGMFKVPNMASSISHHYVFDNEWLVVNSSETFKGYIDPSYEYQGWPVYSKTVTKDIAFKPKFIETIRKYTTTFVNPYDSYNNSIEVDYGTPLKSIIPSVIHHRDDSSLDFFQTYSFVGYHSDPEEAEKGNFLDLSENVVSSHTTYYAAFEYLFRC